MQLANIMLALGGDSGNSVPKYGVTAAEIALLRQIHGNDAVYDIQPLSSEEVNKVPELREIRDGSNRSELGRLRRLYGAAKDAENNSILDLMFPGAAARVFENISELDLDQSLFKATGRVNAEGVGDKPVKPAATGHAASATAAPVGPTEGSDQIYGTNHPEVDDHSRPKAFEGRTGGLSVPPQSTGSEGVNHHGKATAPVKDHKEIVNEQGRTEDSLFGGKGDHDGDGKAGGAADPVPEQQGLDVLTVPKLKELAAERNVDLGDATKKADIIAAIEAAEDVPDEPGEGDMPDTKPSSLFK